MSNVAIAKLVHGTRKFGSRTYIVRTVMSNGYTIGTGQILEAAYPEDCTKDNPKKMSKPGIILKFNKEV